MANTDETSSNSFRDLVELWDDEDFIQYFTPDEIPEKVRTLLTEIQYMEDRIKYLTMEEECKVYLSVIVSFHSIFCVFAFTSSR